MQLPVALVLSEKRWFGSSGWSGVLGAPSSSPGVRVETGGTEKPPFDKLGTGLGCPPLEGVARSAAVVKKFHQNVPTNQFLTRSSAPDIEPAFCATLWPRARASRASSSRPITVAARVCATMSDSALW